MEVNQRNANALNTEQVRIRSVIEDQQTRISRLEAEIVALKAELLSVKMLAVSAIGRGSTVGDYS